MGSSDLLLYRTEDGRDRIEVRLEDETVWLSQDELAEEATVKDYLIVRGEDATATLDPAGTPRPRNRDSI